MPHILQPKQTILKEDDVKKLLDNFNISLSQLPKIRLDDVSLPEGAIIGDVKKIERKEGDETNIYYRVVIA